MQGRGTPEGVSTSTDVPAELLGDPPVTIMALVDEEPEPNNKG